MKPLNCNLITWDKDDLMQAVSTIFGPLFVTPIRRFGRGFIFLIRLMGRIRISWRQIRATLVQVHSIGTRSLVLIMVSGFFVGMVLALQGYRELAQFGATDAVGAILGLSLFRELGPVLTALLFAGRAGTAITAEIGLMKATDQLMAMDLMAIDPLTRVVMPRFTAGCLSLPALTAVFNMMGLIGGSFYAVNIMGIDSGIFWGNMQAHVDLFSDFMVGVYKSIMFGLLVSLSAVYTGYYAVPTGSGVGRATTQTVVVSAVLVLVFDFILTSLIK
jgi:phospholipid/cholesterol/gamma-HCH transport system permease protein